MAFISLGKIDKNLIPILVGCVFCYLNRLLNQYEETILFDNVILTDIFISISDIFTIIPYIIFKIRSKKNSINQNVNDININERIEYLFDNEKMKSQGKWKFIILSGIIFFIDDIMFVLTFKIKTNTWIIYIFVTSIFYFLIFKSKLYRHHYLSIIVIILLGVSIDLVEGNLQNDFSENILYLLVSILRVILLSLNLVIIKYTMEKKFVSPYEIALFNGIINLILFIIFAIIDHYYIRQYDYETYFNNFNVKELLVVLGVMSTQLGIYVCLFLTDKNTSPCHIFIIFVFGQLAYYYDFKSNSIIVIIFLLFILFFSLMFNEIIEINFLGLSYNIKRNIIKRADSEGFDSLIKGNDILDEGTEMDDNSTELNNKESVIYK